MTYKYHKYTLLTPSFLTHETNNKKTYSQYSVHLHLQF